MYTLTINNIPLALYPYEDVTSDVLKLHGYKPKEAILQVDGPWQLSCTLAQNVLMFQMYRDFQTYDFIIFGDIIKALSLITDTGECNIQLEATPHLLDSISHVFNYVAEAYATPSVLDPGSLFKKSASQMYYRYINDKSDDDLYEPTEISNFIKSDVLVQEYRDGSIGHYESSQFLGQERGILHEQDAILPMDDFRISCYLMKNSDESDRHIHDIVITQHLNGYVRRLVTFSIDLSTFEGIAIPLRHIDSRVIEGSYYALMQLTDDYFKIAS